MLYILLMINVVLNIRNKFEIIIANYLEKQTNKRPTFSSKNVIHFIIKCKKKVVQEDQL